jgi:hypothetical protein
VKHAASLQDVAPMLLPGVTLSTSPTDFAPIAAPISLPAQAALGNILKVAA